MAVEAHRGGKKTTLNAAGMWLKLKSQERKQKLCMCLDAAKDFTLPIPGAVEFIEVGSVIKDR